MEICAMRFANAVVVDGEVRNVDLSAILSSNINAITWFDDDEPGEAEYISPRTNGLVTLESLRDRVLQAWQAAAPPPPAPTPEPDPKMVDVDLAKEFVLAQLIKEHAAKAEAPDYVKRAASEIDVAEVAADVRKTV